MVEKLKIGVLPVTPFQQNCALIWCEHSKRGVVTDPGGEVPRILEAIRETGITVERILLTHGHLDHASGTAALRDALKVPVEGPHEDDIFLLDELGEQGRRFGFEGAAPVTPDRFLKDGDTVQIGDDILQVIHCPGHTPGHVVFFSDNSRFAVAGDVLFRGSIGRTDLPRGNHNALVTAITQKLWPLGDDVTFLPGHGDLSTFGWERKTNPFVSDIAMGVA